MKANHIACILLAILFAQGAYMAATMSRTTDEFGAHIGGGYAYLTTGVWGAGINNPPLTGAIAAIPLLFVDKTLFSHFDKGISTDYIAGTAPYYPQWLLFLSRLVTLLFMTALGYFLYAWARDLYGIKAALLSLTLYVFSPTMLSFGSLITADMGGALFTFLSLYLLWKFVHNPTKKGLALTAIIFGIAQITKLLAVFLIPVFLFYFLLIFFLRDFSVPFFPTAAFANRPKFKKFLDITLTLSIIFLTGLLAINLAYLFNGTFTPLKDYTQGDMVLRSETFLSMQKNPILSSIPIPLPWQYVRGHDTSQWQAKDERRPYFFLGQGRMNEPGTEDDRVLSWYYLFHIAVKTPIGLFILLILGFALSRRMSQIELTMLFFIALTLFMLSVVSNLYIGYRHVLSIYPFLFLFAGRVMRDGAPHLEKKATQALIIIALLWYVISSLLIFPHHLAYFNEFIGGPKNGYKYTIDSNLDWEQDLNWVKKYLDNTDEKILVDPGCQPFVGKAIISAQNLQFQKAGCYQWLKQNFEPIDYVGYSWLVYDVKGQWYQTDEGLSFVKST